MKSYPQTEAQSGFLAIRHLIIYQICRAGPLLPEWVKSSVRNNTLSTKMTFLMLEGSGTITGCRNTGARGGAHRVWHDRKIRQAPGLDAVLNPLS